VKTQHIIGEKALVKKLSTGNAPILDFDNTSKSSGSDAGSGDMNEPDFISSSINAAADFDFGDSSFDKELKKQHKRWFNLLRTRFPWKARHSDRVGDLAKDFALYLGATEKAADNIQYASRLHDIGNIWTPGIIINKPSKLTDKEYETMYRHANDGASILVEMEFFAVKKISSNIIKNGANKALKTLSLRKPSGDKNFRERLGEDCSNMTKLAVSVSLNHHGDRFSKDNENGVSDEAIAGYDATVISQLVAICDYYDAMKNPRPYKKGRSHDNALDVMGKYLTNGELAKQGDARAYLDPNLFESFVPFIKVYSIGKDRQSNTSKFEQLSAGVDIVESRISSKEKNNLNDVCSRLSLNDKEHDY
jgi:HD-GYP domain-containing protein (c-di-GMP phosphodiesterase class II)